MSKKYYCGVDIGGTSIKILLVDEDCCAVDKTAIVTNITESGKYIVCEICEAIQLLLEKNGLEIKDCVAIGVGTPGQVDTKEQVIIEAINLGWVQYPLKKEIEAMLGIPTFVDNDANIATYGELKHGAGIGKKSVVVITLGTGVGGGIIIDEKIISGVTGAGGEIGHIRILYSGGKPCNCGNTGCLETLVSASGIVREAEEKLNDFPDSSLRKYERITSEIIFAEAGKGDPLSQLVFEQTAKYLGSAIASIAHMLNPELFIIGGGVSNSGAIFLYAVQKYFKKFAIVAVRDVTEIKVAELGSDAGMIGAATLAVQCC